MCLRSNTGKNYLGKFNPVWDTWGHVPLKLFPYTTRPGRSHWDYSQSKALCLKWSKCYPCKTSTDVSLQAENLGAVIFTSLCQHRQDRNACSRQTAVKTVLQMSGTPQCNSQLCPDRNQMHHRGVPFRAVIKSAIDGQAGRVSGPIFLLCEDC